MSISTGDVVLLKKCIDIGCGAYRIEGKGVAYRRLGCKMPEYVSDYLRFVLEQNSVKEKIPDSEFYRDIYYLCSDCYGIGIRPSSRFDNKIYLEEVERYGLEYVLDRYVEECNDCKGHGGILRGLDNHYDCDSSPRNISQVHRSVANRQKEIDLLLMYEKTIEKNKAKLAVAVKESFGNYLTALKKLGELDHWDEKNDSLLHSNLFV